jgi:hypothetical protein
MEKREKNKYKKMRRPTGATPAANGRADKNDHFHVRGATQTDDRGQ